MRQNVLTTNLIVLLAFMPFRNSICEAKSNAAAGVTISITSGLLIGGAGAFFLVRHLHRSHSGSDSVITRIDSLWNSTNRSFANGDYDKASKSARTIQSEWNGYFDALDKRRKNSRIMKDSLSTIIHCADLYRIQKSALDNLHNKVSTLPADQDQLLTFNRHDLIAILDTIANSIRDSVEHHSRDSVFLSHLYNDITSSVDRVNTLFSEVYDGQRLDFKVKNKFYYNRMTEQNNAVALQRFVDDCDYYKVDKEWCEKARLQLNPQFVQESQPSQPVITTKKKAAVKEPVKKISPVDIMNQQYASAISSRSVEKLDEFIDQYSKKKFKIKAQLDTVRSLSESIKKEIRQEQQFAQEHPRIAESSVNQLTITIRGVNVEAEKGFRQVIETKKDALTALSSIRLPATLSIDYSSTPPLYLLSGSVHSTKDIASYDTLSERRYSIAGAKQGFAFIDTIARACSNILYSATGTTPQAASYAVRLIKNGEIYLTLYGYGKPQIGIDLYNFYDFTIPGHSNIRTTYSPVNYELTFDEQADTLQGLFRKQFFGK